MIAPGHRLMEPQVDKLSRSRLSISLFVLRTRRTLACSLVAFRLRWASVFRSCVFPAASGAAIHIFFSFFFAFSRVRERF
jgi:hypothetical protein